MMQENNVVWECIKTQCLHRDNICYIIKKILLLRTVIKVKDVHSQRVSQAHSTFRCYNLKSVKTETDQMMVQSGSYNKVIAVQTGHHGTARFYI